MVPALYQMVEPIRKAIGLRKEFFQKNNRWVLDIGSGDYARGNICLDRDHGTDPDVVGQATELPFDSGVINEVVCYHLIEHLESSETEQLFAEVRRVLVPGGSAHFLVDRDVDEDSLFGKDPDHERRYEVEVIREMAEKQYYVETFQTWNWIGNINKFGVNFWRHLSQSTKIYLEVRKKPL